jgi:hypothetical protein
MKIQILGTGCPRCEKLTEAVRAAADAHYGLTPQRPYERHLNLSANWLS